MNKDEKNKRRWEDVPKSKSLGYPDEMTKKEIDTSKKKDKDFMQQLKKSLKEKEESHRPYRLGLFFILKKQEGH